MLLEQMPRAAPASEVMMYFVHSKAAVASHEAVTSLQA